MYSCCGTFCRLLKEMGWTESDEEEYEITEDEKKEFQDRCSKQVNLLFIVLFFDGCSLICNSVIQWTFLWFNIVECHTEKQWPVSEDSKPQTCSNLPAQCFGTEWHYILIRFRHWWQCMITDPSSSSSSHISCATSHALGALSTLLSLLVQWSFSRWRIFPYKTWTLLNILGRISLFLKPIFLFL